MAVRKISDLPENKIYVNAVAANGGANTDNNNKLKKSLIELSECQNENEPYTFISKRVELDQLKNYINYWITGSKKTSGTQYLVPVEFYTEPNIYGFTNIHNNLSVYGTTTEGDGRTKLESNNVHIVFDDRHRKTSNENDFQVAGFANNTFNTLIRYITAFQNNDKYEVHIGTDTSPNQVNLRIPTGDFYVGNKFTVVNGDVTVGDSTSSKVFGCNLSSSFGKTLAVTGATTLSTLTVDGNTTLRGTTLTVTGTATFSNPINGTAMRAKWADLAEGYEMDQHYEPGTFVKFGGEKEMTIADYEANAVITTKPGLILGSGKNTESSQDIALTGRTPVKVIGKVNKFDRLVLSETPGVARAMKPDENLKVIGRALEASKEVSPTEITLVEAVVQLSL